MIANVKLADLKSLNELLELKFYNHMIDFDSLKSELKSWQQPLHINKYATEGEVLATLLSADDIRKQLTIVFMDINMQAQGQDNDEFRL